MYENNDGAHIDFYAGLMEVVSSYDPRVNSDYSALELLHRANLIKSSKLILIEPIIMPTGFDIENPYGKPFSLVAPYGGYPAAIVWRLPEDRYKAFSEALDRTLRLYPAEYSRDIMDAITDRKARNPEYGHWLEIGYFRELERLDDQPSDTTPFGVARETLLRTIEPLSRMNLFTTAVPEVVKYRIRVAGEMLYKAGALKGDGMEAMYDKRVWAYVPNGVRRLFDYYFDGIGSWGS